MENTLLTQWYWMIPNAVLFDNRLTDKQKLLFCLISSLCAEKWYCWASNTYLWEKLNVKAWTISNSVKALIDLGYIYSDVNKSKGNERHITIGNVINQNTYCEKSQYPYCEKSQDNNISNNNTNKKWQTKSFSLNKNLSVRLTNICKGDLTFTENVIERLEEYNNTRKKDKKLEKLTDKWFKLVIDKLIKLWNWTEDGMIAVLKQSVENGWEWLFEVKGYKPKVDYENNLQLFLTRLKSDYEWLKKELGNEKFFELKQKALEYWAVNKLL